ncbi:MerR family transcriptional regulator [Nocardia mexicana]|uniref:MerR family transcriptional regulator n=1 Tax=Nocardia mexicana TaxID=279262 RepID=A0A370H6M4_9NOCA|nr:MerR family transcriptional regulator [Nocardia mexicana]RDI49811.1 MerR family transcriptional regulator [Nocardia mexicana]
MSAPGASPHSLTISEVAAAMHLPTSTLRFYEREGLIQPLARRGGKRIYGPDILARLALIDIAKQAGFTIAEVARFMDHGSGTPSPQWRELAEPKLAELDEQIAFAERAKAIIRHGLDCPRASFVGCPVFQELIQSHIEAIRERTGHRGDRTESAVRHGLT